MIVAAMVDVTGTSAGRRVTKIGIRSMTLSGAKKKVSVRPELIKVVDRDPGLLGNLAPCGRWCRFARLDTARHHAPGAFGTRPEAAQQQDARILTLAGDDRDRHGAAAYGHVAVKPGLMDLLRLLGRRLGGLAGEGLVAERLLKLVEHFLRHDLPETSSFPASNRSRRLPAPFRLGLGGMLLDQGLQAAFPMRAFQSL